MAYRQKSDLHVVNEFNREDHPQTGMEDEIRKRRKRGRLRVVIGVIVVAAIVIAAALFVYLQTYTTARVSDTYPINSAADCRYQEFAGGVLKYDSDGISYLNQKGEEQWNQSCQIKTPILSVNDTSAAIADKGGNDILVFTKSGLKGEFSTTLPIEKLCVSKQGIVGVILKDGSTPTILCYDAAGNMLVEHKTSLNGTGYPMDLALSEDGELMSVVYLYVQDGEILSRIAYYNFGEAGEEAADHQVAYKEYSDTVLASTFFVGADASVAVGDGALTFFSGGTVPEEKTTLELDKDVRSVFHSDKYVGLILRNEGKSGYELRLYNTQGKAVLSTDFTGEYKNAKISGNQVILYDGKNCRVFLASGQLRFEGEMENQILEIFPVFGINKYMVVNANGIESVRFVK